MSSTYNIEGVYLLETATIASKLESEGPFKEYFDECFNDLYMKQKSYELSEIYMQNKAFSICKLKANIKHIDLVLGSDLCNQLTASSYMMKNIDLPYIGIYSACASSIAQMIVASCMIQSKLMNHIACISSSHQAVAERQFRYPVEYGIQKRITTTYTVTGAACCIISSQKSKVCIKRITIGKVMDYMQKDVNDMGRVMAIACYDSIIKHLNNTNTSIDDYDFILTGDLSAYGLKILQEMLHTSHIEDCGHLIYGNNPATFMGGSGIACLPLVAYSKIYKELKEGKYHRGLLAGSGALMNPIMVAQKESIPSICHIVELEAL